MFKQKKNFYILKFRVIFFNSNYLLFSKSNIKLLDFENLKNKLFFFNINLKKFIFNKIKLLFNKNLVKFLLNNNLILYFNHSHSFIKIKNIIKNIFLSSMCFIGYFVNNNYLQNIIDIFVFYNNNYGIFYKYIHLYLNIFIKYVYINNLIYNNLIHTINNINYDNFRKYHK